MDCRAGSTPVNTGSVKQVRKTADCLVVQPRLHDLGG